MHQGIQGKEVTFKNNKDAEEHGIAFIHQELNIWPNLSVLENLFLMNQPKTRFGTIDFKKMREILFFNSDIHQPEKNYTVS